MENEELKQVFQRAAEIAKLLPQNLQEAAFNRALDALLPSSPSGKSPSTRKKNRKTGAQQANPVASRKAPLTGKVTGSRSSSNRIGPKGAIESLLKTTYWNQPRTIRELQKHLQTSRGYKYEATELSPALVRLLREDKIERKKNKENQYEYKPK